MRGDVRDRGRRRRRPCAAARPEVVLHLAAQPVVRRAWREPAEAFAVNTLGTVHVLDAVREHAPRGRGRRRSRPTRSTPTPTAAAASREDDPLGGKDPYSASKAAAELVAAAYRDSYGLRVATARAGNVIGGGDWAEDRILPDAVRAARAGAPLVVRDPAALRPWQHVLNPLSRLPRARRAAGRRPAEHAPRLELRAAARARAAPGRLARRALRGRARRAARRARAGAPRRAGRGGPARARPHARRRAPRLARALAARARASTRPPSGTGGWCSRARTRGP